MNKTYLFVSFMILILSGFMFSYVLYVSDKFLESYILMIFYYLSLGYMFGYILIPFIEKPKENKK